MSTCARACGSLAGGSCPECHNNYCESCYAVHECTTSNTQCSVCVGALATYLCLCEYPCPVLCAGCTSKHNTALHSLVTLEYNQFVDSREKHSTIRNRQVSIMQLTDDLKEAQSQVQFAKKELDAQVASVHERLEDFRMRKMDELQRLALQLEGLSVALESQYFAVLFEREVAEQSVRRLLSAKYTKTPDPFRYSVDLSSISFQDCVSSSCPLLDLLTPKACSYCQRQYFPQRSADPLEEDFCSGECYGRFKAQFCEEAGLTSSGQVSCRYCLKDFSIQEGITLPCGQHAFHSLHCFTRYLLKRSRCFKSGELFSCEVCQVLIKTNFIVSLFANKQQYEDFQRSYRNAGCEQCGKPAEVVTDCNHILCADCAQFTTESYMSACCVCGTEAFPDCVKCELNGTVLLSCHHALCRECWPQNTAQCPVCGVEARVVQRAEKRSVD